MINLRELHLRLKRWLFIEESDEFQEWEKQFAPKIEQPQTRGFTWGHYYFTMYLNRRDQWIIDCYRKGSYFKTELETEHEEVANQTLDRIIKNLSRKATV